MARRDNHKAARALADWARHGFTETTLPQITATYEVAPRTLWNWKRALDTDTQLAGLFRDRINDHLNHDWATNLNQALTELVTRIIDLARKPDATLRDVTDAFRALSEVEMTREVLRVATDAEPHRSYPTESSETTTATNASLTN